MADAEPGLARLGRWVAAQTYEGLPDGARRAARWQILNQVAAAHASARHGEVLSLAGAAGFAGDGRSTVIAAGRRCSVADAALANAAYSMAQDFDDIVWMGHTGHSAVWAALAVAEQEGARTADLVTAVAVANEVAGRIGASSFLGPLNGQMWTFIHLAGAAAAAAKLLGLDGERATHALAIALAQPNFALMPGFITPTSKLLAASTPTATGLQAAWFARAGMTGAPSLLEDRRGFWRRFSFVPLPAMLDGLGEFWAGETLQVKTFPGCHYFQTACSALARIAARRPFSVGDVRAVRVDTTKLGAEVARFAADYAPTDAVSPVNVSFDLPTTLAIQMHAGRLGGAEVDPRWLAANADPIRGLRARVTVRHEPELTAKVIDSARAVAAGRSVLSSLGAGDLVRLVERYRDEYGSSLLTVDEAAGWLKYGARRLVGATVEDPLPPAGAPVPLRFPNRVAIDFTDGGCEAEQVDLPVGALAAPGAEGELRAKFVRECAPALGEGGAADAFAAGLQIESVALADFVRLVTAR